MRFIDSHAHITAPAMLPHVEEVLQRARLANIERIVNICTDEESLASALLLHEKYPWVVNTAATTPHDVEKEGESFFPIVEKYARAGSLIAIGETGLDSHYEHSPRALQQEYLIRYLALAKECNLPVVIHCRDAFADLFSIVSQHFANRPLLLHCFTGTLQEAEEALCRGFYLSLSGIVTFKKSSALREVAKTIPLDRLLIETDSPYLAPESQRGKQNEPANIVEVARCVAAVKNVSVEEVARSTRENALHFFSIQV